MEPLVAMVAALEVLEAVPCCHLVEGRTMRTEEDEGGQQKSKKRLTPGARAHVFPDNLLERRPKDTPWKHLDVLFNVARFWVRETHHQLEEIFSPLFGFGNGDRSESFQVSSNSVLFLDGKPHANERFQEVNGIDRGDKAFVLVLAVDARDHDTVRHILGLRDRSERSVNRGTFLSSPELNKTSLGDPFIRGPSNGHQIEILLKLELGFAVPSNVWVECSGGSELTCSHQARLAARHAARARGRSRSGMLLRLRFGPLKRL